MKNFLILLAQFLAYLLGLSSVLGGMLLFNARLGGVSWLVHVLEAVLLLAVGMMLAWQFNQHYQRQIADPLLSNWQIKPTAWAVGYGLLLLLFTIAYDQIRQLFGLPESNPENQQLLLNVMKQAPFQLIVFAVILAPVLEELLFRGLFWRLLGKLPVWAIWLITSIVFAVPHALPTSLDFLIYLMMGGLLGACYWQTRQLKYAMLAHFVNNAITVALMWQSLQAA